MSLPKMSTLQVLKAARERITNIRNWTTNIRWSSTLDAAGKFPQNCALGAIEFAYGFRDWAHMYDQIDLGKPVAALAAAARELSPELKGVSYNTSIVATLNNTMGHNRTLAMFDLAIATEKDRIRKRRMKKVEAETESDKEYALA